MNWIKVSIFSAVSILIVISFQNCGEESLSFGFDSQRQFLYDCVEDPNSSADCPNLKREQFDRSYSDVKRTAPTDILFILDDSCSMRTIATSMASGFDSLQSSKYPDDTKMGLTYMAPVKQDDMGGLDFLTPYHRNVPLESPGLVKLVTKQTIADYVAAAPEHTSSFVAEGCDDAWFSPNQKGSDGKSCLEAVSQLAPICTGVEAGLVTLEQTLKNYNSQGKRLFREGAFVNIIFISDTHEPGANYFGKPNAPQKMKSYEEILSVINTNSPNIFSLKMAGILPIPVDGAPIYNGLKVIGDIPQNDEEAKINGEKFYDYSYLPYIKRTGGSVSHAKTGDWSGLAASLVEDSKVAGTILVSLKESAKKIYLITINDSEIQEDQWSLSSDGRVLTLDYRADANTAIDIDVIYEVELPL